MNEKDENKPKTFQEIINQGSSSNSFSSPSTSKTTSFVDILRGKVTSPTVVPKQVPVTPITTTPSKPKDDSLYKTAQLSIGQGITTGVTTGIKGLNEYSNWFYKKFNKGKDVFGKDSDTQTKLLDEDVKKFEQKIQQGALDTIGEDRMNSYLYQAGSGIGQGVVQLAAFAVNPIAGLSVIAGQTISAGKQAHDDAYEGMIKNGATEEEAKRIANINGNIVGTVNSLEALAPARALKMFGIGNLLKKPVSNSTKAILGRIAKEGLIESSTEAFQEAVQSETARRTWNKEAGVQDTIQDAIASFLVSIPSGILFGGAGEIQLRKNHLDKAELQVKELLQTEAGLDENESKTVAEFIVDNYAITATQDLFSDEERAGIEEFARNERLIQEKENVQEEIQEEQPAFQKKNNEPTLKDLIEKGEVLSLSEREEKGKKVFEADIDNLIVEEKGINEAKIKQIQNDIKEGKSLPFVEVEIKDGKVEVISGKELVIAARREGETFLDVTEIERKQAPAKVNVKAVDEKTRKEITDVIDYLRLNKIPKGKTEKTIEDDVSKLSELFGINQDKPSSFIANKLTTILETKPEGDLDVENPDIPMFQKKATEKAKEDFNQNPKVFTTQLFEDKQPEKQEKLIPAREGVAILKEASQRLGVRFPIAIYRTILTGEVMKDGSLGEAYGMYLDKKISLSQFITATTAQHELGHLLFRNMEDIPLFKGISREKLYLELRAYKKEWNNLSNYELEEKFMELIEQYSIDIQSGKVKKPKTGLQKLVADVYNALRKMLGLSTAEVSSMQKFMDTMYFGKSNEVVTLYDSNKTSDFMEARFKEFGQELKEIPVFQKKGKKATTQEVEEFIKVATQRTTNGRKTAQQIKKELFPKKDTLTIAEQNLIKKRLKQQEKGYIKGIVSGKKIGKEQQIQKQIPITRKQELNSLRENIQRRLYRKTLIEELRKLPRSEWKTLGTDIANVNLSEARYLNTLSKITNRIAELEIANGERKVLALSRRDIGFLRHIYDINQPLINSIKKSLNIRDTYKTGERAGQFKEELKQIKDYTLEELNMFKAELKKRIEFRQQNPVRYFDHVELKEPTVKDMVKDFAGKVIDTMERTLRNINPAIEQRMNTYYFDVNRAKKDRLSKVEPFIKLYYKASKENQYLIKKAALNGEMDKLKTLMETVLGTDPSVTLKEIRTVMDGLHRELVSVGLEVNYLENYFPRLLKPVTKDRAEILVAQLEFKEGRKATSEEREKIITNLTRGFNFVQNPFVTLSGKQFEAERLIENIDDSNADMYEDPATALIQYISAATNVVEQRRLFGKNVVEGADYDSFLGNSITKMVYDYYEQGLIKQKDINKLQEVFNTLFVSNISPNHRYLQKITSKYIYPLTLGQITSTINQVKDLAMQVLKNDIFAGQWNTFRTFGLTPESIGLSDSIMQLEGLAETKDNNAFSRFLEKSMTPFGKTDNFFLKVAVNSIYLKLTKLSKEKNNQKFVKDLENVFGNRAMEVLAELQSKTGNETTVSKDIQRLIWGEIASFRPISDLQKAAYAKKKPMFYVLRNFMIKQLEFVRSESFDIIADGYKKKDAKRTAEGMARLLTLMVVIGGVGAGVDEAKDWILGKKDQKFMDKVAENIMNIVGLNNYMINVGKQRGFAAQLLTSYTPAALSIGGQIADDLRSDIIKIKEGEAEKVKSYRRFPLIGNLVYQRYGGGNK